MIRFCQNTKCGRGFVDAVRRRIGDTPPLLCAACRRPGGKPLSRLLDGTCQLCGASHKGTCQEEAERKQREREARG